MTFETASRSASERAYRRVYADIMSGATAPGAALRPQALATAMGMSLAAVREALLRLVGEGLAVRSPNRGFTVPLVDAARWQAIAQARSIVEPEILRLSVRDGGMSWEARVREAHHTLARTRMVDPSSGAVSEMWEAAHHRFHATLLEASGNEFLLDTFERLWVAAAVARRWSFDIDPARNVASEHAALELAVLERRGDDAADLLAAHILGTAATLRTAPARNDRSGA